MDDIRSRLRSLLSELRNDLVIVKWTETLTKSGVAPDLAAQSAAEIGHVVEEFRTRLLDLVDLLEVSTPDKIPEAIVNFATGVSEVTVPEIVEPMEYLRKLFEPLLPPDPDDDDADENEEAAV